MERNGSKFIFCPFLSGDILAKTTARQIRKEESTLMIRKIFAKRKYKKIPPLLIDWWMDKKYLAPLRLIGIILELIFNIIAMVIKIVKKMSNIITWALIDWCIE